MTLTAAWWMYDQAETSAQKAVYGLAGVAVAGSPYHSMGVLARHLDDVNYWTHAARVNASHHSYMVRRGMSISPTAAKNFAFTSGRFVPMARAGFFPVPLARGRGARIAAKLAGRLVPGLGWGLLAYDLYTVAGMVRD